MQNNLNNNLFRSNDNSHLASAQQITPPVSETDERVSALKRAIKEVEIGTPDSIQLATQILILKKIKITELDSLLHLQASTEGARRTETFEAEANQMQKNAIQKIREILSNT